MQGTDSTDAQEGGGRADIVWSLRRLLVEPSTAIQDPAQRRKARLLAIFVLCLFVLFLCINLAYLIAVPGYRVPLADVLGYVAMAVIYALSRTRFTTVGVIILLLMFPLNVFGNVLEGTSLNIAATLSYLLPSYVLASIFLGVLGTAIFGYGTSLALLALLILAPSEAPTLATVLGPLGACVVTVTLCIISIFNRDLIERDRQTGLKSAYDSTLEGWARALEIRDKETEGHSRRVTGLALRLARVLRLARRGSGVLLSWSPAARYREDGAAGFDPVKAHGSEQGRVAAHADSPAGGKGPALAGGVPGAVAGHSGVSP